MKTAHLQQKEQKDMPATYLLVENFKNLINKASPEIAELICTALLIIATDPDELGKELRVEWKRRGYVTDLF